MGLVEYCIDQCMDGIFMAKPDIGRFMVLYYDNQMASEKYTAEISNDTGSGK